MKRELYPGVCSMTNKYNKVLYTAVTSKVFKRPKEHKENFVGAFTSRFDGNKLEYYEEFETMLKAMARGKQIEDGSRQKKNDLINTKNPEWKDLFASKRNGHFCNATFFSQF